MPGAIKRIDRFDVVEVEALLHAAGLSSLDSPTIQSPSESYRYTGLALIVEIYCPMDRGGGISTCNYQVHHVKRAEAKVSIMNGVDANNHEVQERRGIKLTLAMSGQMGHFEWTAFMNIFATSIVFISTVGVCVDILMTSCLSNRKEYRMLKCERSVDFSSYRAHEAKAVQGMRNLETLENWEEGKIRSLGASAEILPPEAGQKETVDDDVATFVRLFGCEVVAHDDKLLAVTQLARRPEQCVVAPMCSEPSPVAEAVIVPPVTINSLSPASQSPKGVTVPPIALNSASLAPQNSMSLSDQFPDVLNETASLSLERDALVVAEERPSGQCQDGLVVAPPSEAAVAAKDLVQHVPQDSAPLSPHDSAEYLLIVKKEGVLYEIRFS